MNIKDYASLKDLARMLGVAKGTLYYYLRLGIISPVARMGNVDVFDIKQTKETLKKVDKMRKKFNIAYRDIGEILKKEGLK